METVKPTIPNKNCQMFNNIDNFGEFHNIIKDNTQKNQINE